MYLHYGCDMRVMSLLSRNTKAGNKVAPNIHHFRSVGKHPEEPTQHGKLSVRSGYVHAQPVIIATPRGYRPELY